MKGHRDLRGLDSRDLIYRSVRNFFEHDMATYASALAFRMLLALFPFAFFLVALLGMLQYTDFFAWLILRARAALTEDYPLLGEFLLGDAGLEVRGGLLSAGVLVALWSVSAGARSLIKALNVVYGVEETRPPARRFLLSAVSAPALAAVILVSALLMLLGPRAIEWIASLVWLDAAFVALWRWLRIPVALVLLTLVISLIYYAAPDAHQPFRLITPGAALAVVVWAGASLVFSYYAANLASYGAYGGLGSAILLLLYFYISSAVLLLGAEVNAVIYGEPRVR
jgi:membrane protein